MVPRASKGASACPGLSAAGLLRGSPWRRTIALASFDVRIGFRELDHRTLCDVLRTMLLRRREQNAASARKSGPSPPSTLSCPRRLNRPANGLKTGHRLENRKFVRASSHAKFAIDRLRRFRIYSVFRQEVRMENLVQVFEKNGIPNGNRTRVSTLKGWCPNR